MEAQLLIWIIARAAGLASYAALCLAVLSGIALRTSVLDFLAKNRALRALHDWVSWLWIPLGALHVVALLLDRTARIGPADLLIPFGVSYGAIAIGLGTISFDLILIIVVSSWLRRRMSDRIWRWIHRSSYVAFVTLFLHAALSGTDFNAPLISALSWAAALGIGLLGISRIVFGRLPD
ncbi:MAG TPA: ferric reductase-like transmembrane domain-containing protein [Candidatus Saccharimonadales bacterium]|nr:ferric reductase-like transmembrane domain-containing protein [Candidatus Saccharimonadales bacterium]